MEVFSAQEKSPLAHWNVSGIKKVKSICARIVAFVVLLLVLWRLVGDEILL